MPLLSSFLGRWAPAPGPPGQLSLAALLQLQRPPGAEEGAPSPCTVSVSEPHLLLLLHSICPPPSLLSQSLTQPLPLCPPLSFLSPLKSNQQVFIESEPSSLSLLFPDSVSS